MGFHGFDFPSQAAVYDEHVQLTKGTSIDISGLSYEKLRSLRSVQWPVPHPEHKGTPRLFSDHTFHTPSRKAKFHSLPPDNQSAPVTPEHPLILTTGRIRDQWHTMTKTGKVNRLRQHIDKPFLEIHPEDAETRNITDGDVVEIKNLLGDVRVRAKVTTEIKKGVVFLPMHWGKILTRDAGRANNLTTMLVDPLSKEPDFKFSAVEVSRYEKPAERIIIAGAGAASYRFLCTFL
jgi:ferredoxin-nitrate reductase